MTLSYFIYTLPPVYKHERHFEVYFPDNTAMISLLNTFYFSYLGSPFMKFLFFKWDKEQRNFFLLFYIDNQLSHHLC